MKKTQGKTGRPDIDAAVRGGDWTQAMDGEGVPADATLEHARNMRTDGVATLALPRWRLYDCGLLMLGT